MDAQGYPKSSLGVVSGGSWGSPGALLSAPGLLWGTFWASWGGNLKPLGMNFVTQGCVRSETSEKLQFDDLLNENAMLLTSRGLQNEAKMIPKRPERRKRSREEAKREQRSAKSALESVVGALWDKFLRFQGSLGEGRWNARLLFPCLAGPAFRRVWAPKVRKSAVR